MQAYSMPCWWVSWWLWRAGCISQDTYLLYVSRVWLEEWHFVHHGLVLQCEKWHGLTFQRPPCGAARPLTPTNPSCGCRQHSSAFSEHLRRTSILNYQPLFFPAVCDGQVIIIVNLVVTPDEMCFQHFFLVLVECLRVWGNIIILLAITCDNLFLQPLFSTFSLPALFEWVDRSLVVCTLGPTGPLTGA